jgi:hypothetical protein
MAIVEPILAIITAVRAAFLAIISSLRPPLLPVVTAVLAVTAIAGIFESRLKIVAAFLRIRRTIQAGPVAAKSG